MPEIYALIDPRDGAIRYIGKANDSRKRLVKHLADARRRRTPVYDWINMLAKLGMRPTFQVLEVADDWVEAERRLIAEARDRGERLLNVADGGDEPYCPPEVRSANARNATAKRPPYIWKFLIWAGGAIRDARKYGNPAAADRMTDKIEVIKRSIEAYRSAGRLDELEAFFKAAHEAREAYYQEWQHEQDLMEKLENSVEDQLLIKRNLQASQPSYVQMALPI